MTTTIRRTKSDADGGGAPGIAHGVSGSRIRSRRSDQTHKLTLYFFKHVLGNRLLLQSLSEGLAARCHTIRS